MRLSLIRATSLSMLAISKELLLCYLHVRKMRLGLWSRVAKGVVFEIEGVVVEDWPIVSSVHFD